ncbi:MAG TPA: hypothetical protein ENK66_09195 [Arcobacter sp.]|nr:hypothetical protein [Arcobacter sp.]
MLTYGEAWFLAKEKTYKDGTKLEDVTELPPLKPRMERKEASRYYNSKLEEYFVSQVVETIPKNLRLKAVQYMMYGHPNKGILNDK